MQKYRNIDLLHVDYRTKQLSAGVCVCVCAGPVQKDGDVHQTVSADRAATRLVYQPAGQPAQVGILLFYYTKKKKFQRLEKSF